MDERRDQYRMLCDELCRLELDDGLMIEARALNLSHNGLLFACRHQPRVGDTIRVQLLMFGEEEPVQMQAEVVRVESDATDADMPWRVGCWMAMPNGAYREDEDAD